MRSQGRIEEWEVELGLAPTSDRSHGFRAMLIFGVSLIGSLGEFWNCDRTAVFMVARSLGGWKFENSRCCLHR